jgi:hypothetical protein
MSRRLWRDRRIRRRFKATQFRPITVREMELPWISQHRHLGLLASMTTITGQSFPEYREISIVCSHDSMLPPTTRVSAVIARLNMCLLHEEMCSFWSLLPSLKGAKLNGKSSHVCRRVQWRALWIVLRQRRSEHQKHRVRRMQPRAPRMTDTRSPNVEETYSRYKCAVRSQFRSKIGCVHACKLRLI